MVVGVSWEIAEQIGPHSDPNIDGSGWVWELQRGEGKHSEARRVFVEISRTALVSTGMSSTVTAAAIESEGRTEVERVAQLENPPRKIKCNTHGVRDVYPDDSF